MDERNDVREIGIILFKSVLTKVNEGIPLGGTYLGLVLTRLN